MTFSWMFLCKSLFSPFHLNHGDGVFDSFSHWITGDIVVRPSHRRSFCRSPGRRAKKKPRHPRCRRRRRERGLRGWRGEVNLLSSYKSSASRSSLHTPKNAHPTNAITINSMALNTTLISKTKVHTLNMTLYIDARLCLNSLLFMTSDSFSAKI